MDIISRKEAKSKGLIKYFTGKECRSGHMSPKYSGSGSCCQCIKDKSKPQPVNLEEIRKLISYDSDTGFFYWLARKDNKSFNTAKAGTRAGNKNRPNGSRTHYLRLRIDNQLHLAHRVAWAMHYGEWPNGPIDHIDGNGLNNRIDNIRLVTMAVNSRNCRLSKNNTTGVNGVYKNPHGYVAEIMVDRKKISLGSYNTIEEAQAARKAADKIYGFYENHGEDR